MSMSSPDSGANRLGLGGGGVEVCYKAALYDVVLDALKILHSSVVFHPSGKLIYI